MRHLPLSSYRPRASVYVLQRLDRSRFKIGWALDPHKRVRQLPEFDAKLVDLRRSSVLWLPSRHRAEQVERSMQKSLGPYRSPADHHGDGHSEWFDGIAHHIAVRLLGQIPIDAGTGATGKLVQLDLRAAFEDDVACGPGPLEAWWALEDLLLRTAQCRAVTVSGGDPSFRVVIHRCRSKCDPLTDELRSPLVNLDTYRWHQGGTDGCFVSLIHYECDDLVCTLTSLRVVEGWPDGADLACLLRAFLVRLREMTNARGWR
jgi:hypothetical protein